MVIGSTAIKHFYPEFRSPKDLDLMEKGVSTKKVERHWIPEFDILIEKSSNKEYLDPDLLLTLKASHANWNIHWDKTMHDILFLKRKGHRIDHELYCLLKKGWKQIHGRESAPLKGKDSKTFFEDNVKRKYVHDSIHEAVAVYDRPIYERILKSPDSVECSKEKFNELSHEDKVRMAKEEVWVTALERYLVPSEFNFNTRRAYFNSLKKFVTTMSTGWMSFFLIDNFEDMIQYDTSYLDRFHKNAHKLKLNNG